MERRRGETRLDLRSTHQMGECNGGSEATGSTRWPILRFNASGPVSDGAAKQEIALLDLYTHYNASRIVVSNNILSSSLLYFWPFVEALTEVSSKSQQKFKISCGQG